MAYQLSERDKSILGAIIQEYVSTGEPVGSRILSKKYMPALSPATVRNVMADLEELGLLYQPHISAGRIPTPRASGSTWARSCRSGRCPRERRA
jgi:heat-inducible transcriptional repressor